MSVRLPRHLANEAAGVEMARVAPAAIDDVDGIDVDGIDVVAARTAAVAHGADAHRFNARLAAGLAAASGSQEPDGAAGGFAGGFAGVATVSPVDLVGISAWRAGALPLRADALARIERMVDEGASHVAAAILGLDADDMVRFIERQRTDRWWWPGRDAFEGYVAAVGGFVGLGGEWADPPREAWPLHDDGAFAVLTGSTWWRLDADVWGSRLVALAEPPARWSDVPPVARQPTEPSGVVEVLATHSWSPGVSVSLVLPPTTYLAWLRVGSR